MNSKKQPEYLTENSNEIEGVRGENEGAASGVGDSHKLYNKNLQMALEKLGKEIEREVDKKWIKKTNSKFYNYLYGDK